MYFCYLHFMTSSTKLSRGLGRVASIQRTLLRLALRDIPGIEPEWYYFLHSVNERKTIRKTDLISFNLLLEPTTGIDILNRMIKAGLLDEKEDPADGRARLLSLTKQGQQLLKKAEQQVERTTALLFGKLTGPEQSTMEAILGNIENQFGPLLMNHRPKTMKEFTCKLHP
jgi:DNA-binding MarR family transcriptional regulator